MRPRVAAICAGMLLFFGYRGSAQIVGVVDLETGSRYVWHGITRSSGFYVIPTEAVLIRFGSTIIEGGSSQVTEPRGLTRGTNSESGATGRHLGELDAWGGIGLVLGPATIDFGAIRYSFHGDSLAGGLGPKSNTTELHFSLAAQGAYLNPRVDAWWDVQRVHGVYLDARGSVPVLGFPFRPFFFIDVDGDVGLNISQQSRNGRPPALVNFAEQGITHASLGASVQVVTAGNPESPWSTIAVGGRGQLNFDAKTQVDGSSGPRRLVGVLWARVNLLVGQVPGSNP